MILRNPSLRRHWGLLLVSLLVTSACGKSNTSTTAQPTPSRVDPAVGRVFLPSKGDADPDWLRPLAQLHGGVSPGDVRICDALETHEGVVVVFSWSDPNATASGDPVAGGGLAFLSHSEGSWAVGEFEGVPLVPGWEKDPSISALMTIRRGAGSYLGGFVDPSARTVELVASGNSVSMVRLDLPCFVVPLVDDPVQLRILRGDTLLAATSIPWTPPAKYLTPSALSQSASDARRTISDLLADPAGVTMIGPEGPSQEAAEALGQLLRATPHVTGLKGGQGFFIVNLSGPSASAGLILYLVNTADGPAVVAYEYRRMLG